MLICCQGSFVFMAPLVLSWLAVTLVGAADRLRQASRFHGDGVNILAAFVDEDEGIDAGNDTQPLHFNNLTYS